MISIKETSTTKTKLKVLCCQLDAKFKDPDYNIKRCQTSLLKYTKRDKIDVILLPELALVGYQFKNKSDIDPFCEECGKGKYFKFASQMSKILESYIMVGYPEIFIDSNNQKFYYNSLYVVDRKGNLLLNYRKHHLYETDQSWATEGEDFKTIVLLNSEGVSFKAAIAICMDINPYEFKDPNKYELADFCKKEKIDAIFFSSAWLDNEDSDVSSKSINKMLNYWINRLAPLINTKEFLDNYDKEIAFFCADRVGKEEDKNFVGCSCSLKLNPIELVGVLDKKNEGYLMAEISLR